ncbi:coenzyme F420 hydrogenase subunit delta [Desulfacinum hydrothermale DSM 13146]|uniref:Coenzyme F420 hydrogenase subunit delta n=1 Tax=Desulfacinum hydrothermale DSM 13146 TaxID=1121390 RepID=A0A1W1XR75_9BACT|nr:hydrogenase maturation protease [Desulfacinum hydrothermale]SMC25998.1 coenzyme F420 hydrogenase subunit delta [Desulfacinum hydrothermale DSM 13146]
MNHPLFSKTCLVLGCGNTLLGDDGFGPKVIEQLQSLGPPPSSVAFVDAGTAVRDILFDLLLSPEKPQQLILVDTGQDPEKAPGEIFEIDVDRVLPAKIHDFSLHQFPTTNMLKELSDHTDVRVRIWVVQPEFLPDQVSEGLSPSVARAVPRMAERILRFLRHHGYA